MAKARTKSIPLTDFSDKAKKKRGIEPRDLAMEIKALAAQIEAERVAHDASIERFRARVRDALMAFDDNRRGDGMNILRALVRRTDGKVEPSLPQQPGAA